MIVKAKADIELVDLTADQVECELIRQIDQLLTIAVDSLNSRGSGVSEHLQGEQAIAEIVERTVAVDFVNCAAVPLKVSAEINGDGWNLRYLAEPDFATVEHTDLTTTRITYEVVND